MVSQGSTKDHRGKWNTGILLTDPERVTWHALQRATWGSQGRVQAESWGNFIRIWGWVLSGFKAKARLIISNQKEQALGKLCQGSYLRGTWGPGDERQGRALITGAIGGVASQELTLTWTWGLLHRACVPGGTSVKGQDLYGSLNYTK